MDLLQVHVCGYMLQVHVHGYVIGKMYVNMLSYRYIQLDVHHFIGMLYCMDWSSCFIDGVSFFLSFSLSFLFSFYRSIHPFCVRNHGEFL